MSTPPGDGTSSGEDREARTGAIDPGGIVRQTFTGIQTPQLVGFFISLLINVDVTERLLGDTPTQLPPCRGYGYI